MTKISASSATLKTARTVEYQDLTILLYFRLLTTYNQILATATRSNRDCVLNYAQFKETSVNKFVKVGMIA